MWKILQYNKPDDWVLSTGYCCSVKKFVEKVAKKINLKIYWKGRGINEKAYLTDNNKCIIELNKKYFRPLEVDYLKGDSKKAKKKLKWQPKYNLNSLINDMLNKYRK